MWRTTLVLCLLLALVQAEESSVAITPEDCSLECIRQGGPGCDYCRVRADDLKKALGFNPNFGNCIPWPCLELMQDPKLCQHYVQAPNDVRVEVVPEPDPHSDAIVVYWKPSYYGIAFLRGFQVLQALGGYRVDCQLFLFNRNVSLQASHAQMVYRSDPFVGLPLGTQYAITVMALPVPEEWNKFYHSQIVSTRTCAEKNSLDQCKHDWYPQYVEVHQEGSVISVTFNLAPPELGIQSYFSVCYVNGARRYIDITPDTSKNKTHHRYQLKDLQEATNYTCEIAANEVDAVRKTFNVHVMSLPKGSSAHASLAVVLPVCLTALLVLGLLLATLFYCKSKFHKKTLDLKADADESWQHKENGPQEEVVLLPGPTLAPPRLLICYSSNDGPAHVKTVMEFGAFIQRQMATQVCLDLWDSLSMAEEGCMAWHCRQIKESNFVMVMCSPGLNQKSKLSDPESGNEEAHDFGSNAYCSEAVIRLIGEEVGRAKARGEDLSKYMSAIFEYSEETDIPIELRLVSHYTLPRDLPMLFSHLHGVPLHRPGCYLKINHITEEGFAQAPAGAALQSAIQEAAEIMKEKRLRTEAGA